MLDGMSDSIQRSRIENLHSREVDRQSPTGLIFIECIVLEDSDESYDDSNLSDDFDQIKK